MILASVSKGCAFALIIVLDASRSGGRCQPASFGVKDG